MLLALLPTLLPIHLWAVWMCRCLYRYHCLLAQEVLACALLVVLLAVGEASSCQPQHHWPLAVPEALSVPALAEEAEVLV